MIRFLALFLPRTPLLVSAALLVVMVLAVPAFQRPAYWLSLCDIHYAPAALALALTPVVIAGGIDLSVGSLCVLVTIVVGALWRDAGWPIEAALAAGAGVGIVLGVANGLLVVVGILPLVATLATRELYRGLAHGLSGDNPVTRFPPQLGEVWRTPVGGLPLSLLGLAGFFVITYLAVHHTVLGRRVFALGDNELAARFAAVPVRRIKLALYAWTGLTAGLCGAANVMKYGSAKADAEKSLELTAIACVVLGGVRITGGAGNVGGTALGVVTVIALWAGLSDAAPNWRETITGGLLIAVAVVNEAGCRFARGALRAASERTT